ncbi:lipopolysaccharide biosynthesis protein [Metabacillus halosaccharovorans]|uniref:lipopolysaccharide biosynthesis protein n=1 Tax=Metabacillus halosaccharovorans TaxID=930124 RepID=UPI000995DEE1|nr:oligosaccharide flippase family protein [Metabacillus halosaccharovorans]
MLKNLKRLGGDSLLYALMNVGTKLIAFIMMPIYSYLLPLGEFGYIDIIDRWTTMLTFLVFLGTDSALAFYYFDTKDEKRRKIYSQNVFVIRLAMVLVIFLLVLLIGPLVASSILPAENGVYLLLLSIGVLFFDTITALVLTVMRFEFKTVKVVVLTVTKMLLIAVGSYLFLKLVVQSVEGIMYARILTGLLIFLLILKPLSKVVTFKLNREVLKDLIKYGLPLVPASLAFWIILNSSSFFLATMKSPEEVGIYGAAAKFAALITLVTSGIQMAWRPYSMSIKDKPNNKELFSKIYIIIFLLGIIGVFVVATIMPYVILLMEDSYHSAYKYVALISAATFLNFYYLIISIGIFFTKETKVISYIFAIAAGLSIVLNFILVPAFSIWGVVAATLISYTFAIVFIFRKSQKLYYIPFPSIKVGLLFIVMIAGVIGITYVQENQLSLWYVAAIWGAFLLSIGATRIDKELRKKTVEATEPA